MAIVPVAYDIPDEIVTGLLTGELTRFGSVVRDRTEIIAHLKEVASPEGQEASAAMIAALKNPKVLIGLGVVAVAAVGGMAFWAAGKKKQVTRPEMSKCVENYNASLGEYLAAVQNGSLDVDVVNRLILALDAVKEESDSGKMTIEFSTGQSETLVNLVVDYTRRLVEANSVELSEFQELTPKSEDNSIIDLRRYLEAQMQIFNNAA